MSDETEPLLRRLEDLERRRDVRHMHTESGFLNEEEQAEALKRFPPSLFVRYEGGYPEARKKKIIFPKDAEDDFFDLVCLVSEVDLRFRRITHRDVLGALMSLQIDRTSFGDLWVDEENSRVCLYTSHEMGRFLMDHFTRIADLEARFSASPESLAPVRKTREVACSLASLRMDCVTAALGHTSREKAKEWIRLGRVHVNHSLLEKADLLCHNDYTISIRGIGRFQLKEIRGVSRKGRITAVFLQDI